MPPKQQGGVAPRTLGHRYEDFQQSLRNLFNTRNDGNDADLTIVCRDKRTKVHSFVLCIKSKFFVTALKGAFKEAEIRIRLPEDDWFLVHRLLRHCYMYNYRSSSITVEGLAETTHVSELHTNVQMYALAEKYDFADLRVEAIHKFNYFLNGKLEEQKAAELSTVLTSIPDIYNTTPESDHGLRDSIVAYGVEHWQAILKVPDLHDVVPTQFVVEVSGKPQEKLTEKAYNKLCFRCKSKDKFKVIRVACACGRWEDV